LTWIKGAAVRTAVIGIRTTRQQQISGVVLGLAFTSYLMTQSALFLGCDKAL
jgi:hypothetical protein